MSITEQTLARLRSAESYCAGPAAIVAMLTLLSGDVMVPPAVPAQKPCIISIESSSSSFQACRITSWSDTEKRRYQPRTALGEKLIAIREQAMAKGLRLLDADEIVEEVRLRRGEIS